MDRPARDHPAPGGAAPAPIFRIEHWPPAGARRDLGAAGAGDARGALLAHADRLGAIGAAGHVVLVSMRSGEPAVRRPVAVDPTTR
jgi:hypothetical protein